MDDKSDKISQLEDRIEQLEATTKKMMPTRRDALKYGGAAALGAAAMAGTASAGSAQVGTIGDSNNLVDVEAEDINVSDTLTVQDIVVNGSATGPFGGGPSDFFQVQVNSFGQKDPMEFDNILSDDGNNFNASTYLYNTPSAGIYYFNVGIVIANAGDTQFIQLKNYSTNDVLYRRFFNTNTTNVNKNASFLVSLNANQNIGVRSGPDYSSGSDFSSTFSGIRLA